MPKVWLPLTLPSGTLALRDIPKLVAWPLARVPIGTTGARLAKEGEWLPTLSCLEIALCDWKEGDAEVSKMVYVAVEVSAKEIPRETLLSPMNSPDENRGTSAPAAGTTCSPEGALVSRVTHATTGAACGRTASAGENCAGLGLGAEASATRGAAADVNMLEVQLKPCL